MHTKVRFSIHIEKMYIKNLDQAGNYHEVCQTNQNILFHKFFDNYLCHFNKFILTIIEASVMSF